MDKPWVKRTALLSGVLVLAASGPIAASGRPPGGSGAAGVHYTLAAARAHYTPAGCAASPKNTPGKIYARCQAVVWTPNLTHRITGDPAGPPSAALGPADIQSAYKLPATGGGQTVAVVDAFGDSHAESDLATFRSFYGLPACTTANRCFRKVDQTGGANYPPDNSDWGLETSLDLDAISAACPACNILLTEGNSNSVDDLAAAVDEAVALGAKYVSNSYGTGEFSGEQSFDSFYDHPGVAVVASSGDGGFGTIWPSTSLTVTAAGGTRLTKDPSAPRGWDETVWGSSSGGVGTGSGCSPLEPKPEFQNGVSTGCDMRAVSDLAADADPASGLATFDTLGQAGWLQVGGTSLASPLLAAMYALAGSPVPGTYPVSYPYHDPHQATDLFDITQGANGGCGNLLCQGGPGWDGPTGLGTPNGVTALSSGPQGQLTGQVTDHATGRPLESAIVEAGPGDYVTHTDANGDYTMSVAAGGYSVTAKNFGYTPATQSGIQVTANQTTTANFALAPAPSATLAGTVTDGSGHGWPLHARITVEDTPLPPSYSSPYTGRYSVTLPQGSYTIDVATDYPGYSSRQVQVNVATANVTQDITLAADLAACVAPGYGYNGLTADFTGWSGNTPRAGWTIAGSDQGWRFDNPADRPPPPGEGDIYLPGGNDSFAIADSNLAGSRPLTTTLTSPPIDLSGQTAPQVQFDSEYFAYGDQQTGQVDLSTDGGATWATIWHQGSANALGPVRIPIPQAAGRPRAEVRFRYTAANAWYWAIDNVFVGTHTCVPLRGGLLAGVVTDKSTGGQVNGAQVAAAGAPAPPWPAGLSQPTGDADLPGGFYWLFSPATGSQPFSATADGYATATATVNVTAGQVTRQDWALSPGGG